ncbi:MAG TPA: hypothetical protein VFA10_11485 [Ktedonobacteraceae bacterium]|nr:hypothetical protein [Ktedonobacteraceae bacterium]
MTQQSYTPYERLEAALSIYEALANTPDINGRAHPEILQWFIERFEPIDAHPGPVVAGSQSVVDQETERALIFDRDNGRGSTEKVYMGVMQAGSGPVVGMIATYSKAAEAFGEPTDVVDLGKEELRYLYSLLSKPEVQAMIFADD